MAVNDQYLIPGLFPLSRLCGNPEPGSEEAGLSGSGHTAYVDVFAQLIQEWLVFAC